MHFLSHHVDDFTLVSAFFLFSIGCLNILAGLIFRQGAKSKRSITSWKDHAKSALPTHVAGVDVRPVLNNPPTFVSNMFTGSDEKDRNSTASSGSASSGKAGYGFGRQGEKAAAMKVFHERNARLLSQAVAVVRSYDSTTHEKRLSKYRVTDEELFEILSYVMLPKATDISRTSEAKEREKEREREREHSRLSALSSFSIGDMFKDIRDGPKSVRFPEKLIKVLEQKLQDIAMGKDPEYTDQFIRRTMAVFYGQFKVDSFKKQMKENRKIEELILMFATHATGVLKKEPTLSGDGWKLELNNQIAKFVKLLRDSLRNLHHVSPELLGRLDMYTAKLAPATASSPDPGYETASNRDSVASSLTISGSVADMPLVKTVAALYQLPEPSVQKEVDHMRSFCTEKFQTCLKNINAGSPFPGRREDFESDAAWQQWKMLETNTSSTNDACYELAKSTPSDVLPSTSGRPGSVYSETPARQPSIGSRRSFYESVGTAAADDENDEEIQVGHNFTYIPPNPKRFYKRLLEMCLLADLELMMSPEVDDNDEVSLGILSSAHIDLISECALRWRIGQSYRTACFLDLVKSFYERNDVPLECIPEAMSNIDKAMHDVEIDKWPSSDIEYLCSIYGSIFNVFLSHLYHAMDAIPNLKRSDIDPFLNVLLHISDSGLMDHFDLDIEARLTDVQNRVRQVASLYYEDKMRELQAAPGVNRALPLLLMTDEIEKHAKALDKRFPEPILGKVDVVSLVVEVKVPNFITDLHNSQKRLFESSMNGPTPDVPIQDIFALYRRTKTLLGMHSAFCPEAKLEFDMGSFFEPYVRQWLINTDAKTGNWVEAWEAENAEGYSSSIVDLFDSLRSPINFLEDLEWEDEYQTARFFTSLSKTVSKAVEQYCRNVETLFLGEMFPRPTDYLQPQKSSAWLEKARQLAAQGEKKVEPFNFQPESCVKLNNVEGARRLLDNMYNQIQADKIADILAQHPPVPEKIEQQKFLFSVKIVLAEGLGSQDSISSTKLDTFVTLSDESGSRLAKTRTIYETSTPRFVPGEETFDISVEKPLWLMVSVRDRTLVGKHDTVGRAYLCLDPRRFNDLLTHDLWMDLDTAGRVLVRISMEGEKDDIQFFFGRAFRFLKRAESDMLRIFIDKRWFSLRETHRAGFLDVALYTAMPVSDCREDFTEGQQSRVWTITKQSVTTNPLPQAEKPRVRPEELTDVEIEQAILPLFDYFDANLQTLNTYLSDTAKEKVMTRVWKEILSEQSDMKPLSDKEVDIVFKWLKFLRDYFYAGGEGPVPLELLQNQKYRDVVSIRLYYDWTTDALMEECVRMMQQSLRSSAGTIKKRAKSVYQQRNLGTIKERKKEKREKEKEDTNGQIIMQILRMRPGTSEFIAQQLDIMTQVQQEQEQRARQVQNRKLARGGTNNRQSQIPAVPPLPS
ncbi:hypothetical protein D9758_007951 [Tetrapyrgos nigripes]|uniref:Uncharacterized protein n=1 Tax=Tetrapyrgos nigripes TaxID=182062 RepID=A0A8H5FX35_9AGAR|nr:hypothetical protein D9758_007951 [Tetrapyrgos nigripes]